MCVLLFCCLYYNMNYVNTLHIQQQDRKIKAKITVKDTGAHELQKVAKDHETYAVCQMPSQSKFFGYHG